MPWDRMILSKCMNGMKMNQFKNQLMCKNIFVYIRKLYSFYHIFRGCVFTIIQLDCFNSSCYGFYGSRKRSFAAAYTMQSTMCANALQWYHNEHDGVSNHQRLACLFSRLFKPTSKKSKPALLTLCEGNPPVTGGFRSQRASNAETVFIWWRHHG